jgi:hypothetical protein
MAQSEDDGAGLFGEEAAADTMAEPSIADMAPPPGEVEAFGAAPAASGSAGQSAPADEGAPMEITANSAGAEEAEAAPMLQADQAEHPAPASTPIILVPTGSPLPVEPSPTATLPPTAVAQERPPAEDDAAAREAGPAVKAQAEDEEPDYLWLAASGMILLAVSVTVFIFGRKKARHA